MSKQSRPTSDLNPFSAFMQGQLTDWHEALEDLAIQALDAVGHEEWSTVNQGLEKARQAGKIDAALEGAFHDAYWKAVRVSAVYGYALARTYPSGLDEFADWPQRALELAGLPIAEGSDDADPSSEKE